MKQFLLFFFIGIGYLSHTQVVYDFTADPLTNGWSYYDDYGSSPAPAFVHNPTNGNIDFNFYTYMEVSIFHTPLPSALSKNYCVSFKITPTNSNNYNGWFPLLLAPYEIGGTDPHPWRLNAPSSVQDGAFQNLDIIGVVVGGLQVGFAHRDNDIISNNLQFLNNPFTMQANYDYWIKLELYNDTIATLSIYQDAAFSNQLATETFMIPDLEDMNHLYIANSNGATSGSIQNGLLDDYVIDNCSIGGVQENDANNVLLYPNPATDKVYIESDLLIEDVTIIDFLGRIVEIDRTGLAEINVSSLTPGAYVVLITTENGLVSRIPLIKKN